MLHQILQIHVEAPQHRLGTTFFASKPCVVPPRGNAIVETGLLTDCNLRLTLPTGIGRMPLEVRVGPE
eukprot:1714039-Karenia_brevis.AAC.1